MKEDIGRLVKNILLSRKNSNKITELIELINVKNHETKILPAIDGAVQVFRKLYEREEILLNSMIENELKTKVNLYKLWIGERFVDCVDNILNSLPHISADKRKTVLTNFFELLKVKCDLIVTMHKGDHELILCEDYVLQLLTSLIVTSDKSLSELIFSFLKYDDIRYVILKVIPLLCSDLIKCRKTSDIIMENLFNLLKNIANQMSQSKNDPISFLMSEKTLEILLDGSLKETPFSLSQQRKVYSKAWLVFLKLPFNVTLHKEVLVILHSALIPNFSKPRLLSDFLTRSFSQGGGLALLGLQGLFVLVHEHNLEYPDFYKHLYTLLHPRIFEKKYKSRFFNLLQTFLSSTHLPSYIIAAFVKKLSRLTLSAPPHGTLVLLALINFLLKLHPSILKMIDSKVGESVNNDPFIEHEEDLAQCNALNSSLWEIETLVHHYLPEVSQAAMAVKCLNAQEPDLDDLVETGYRDLIAFDEDIFVSNVMNDETPMDVLGGFEDITAEFWTY